MRNKFLLLMLTLLSDVNAQIGIGTTNPNKSAALEIRSSNKGLLVPRMSSMSKQKVLNPANGLLLYQVDSIVGFCYFDSIVGSWKNLNLNNLNDLNDVKMGGSNFLGSVLIGSEKTGLLNNAEYNLGFGHDVLANITTGDKNIAIGYNALNKTKDGYYNIGLGNSALYANVGGYNNIAVGNSALYSNTTGSWNTALGEEALQYNSTASWNTAVGFWALRMNSTGQANVALGNSSMNANTVGSSNVSIGNASSYSGISGNYNTTIGAESNYSNSGSSNITAVGYKALYNNLAAKNTAVGSNSLNKNSTGENNVALGNDALFKNNSGAKNCGIGNDALSNITTNRENTAVGYESGKTLNIGSSNTFLGAFASGDSVTNSTAIGFGAVVSKNNQIQLGNSDIEFVTTNAVLDAATVRTSVKTVNSNYNANLSDDVIIATSALTITLPSAAKAGKGKVFHIKHLAGTADVVTITANSSKIDGSVSWGNLNNKYESLAVVSDGLDYFVFGTSSNQ